MVLAGGLAMVGAAQTAAAPAVVWMIIAVAMLCLAFWLTAVMVADRRQATFSRRQRVPAAPEQAGRPEALGRRAMPRQRGGAADRAERTLTWPGSPDPDEGEYW
jgi:hypothetical protein